MRIRVSKRGVLLGVVYAALIIAGLYLGNKLWMTHKAWEVLPRTPMNQFKGPPDSTHTIIEFMDYRCSYCRDIDPVMREVLQKHPDVKLIYRHYPIFGRTSVIDAEVALAAGMQGKFTEAHDILIGRETPMTEKEIDDMARDLGLDLPQFRKDMKGPDIGYQLLETLDISDLLGVKSTPTFIIGGKLYDMNNGMPTVETFDKLLEDTYGSAAKE